MAYNIRGFVDPGVRSPGMWEPGEVRVCNCPGGSERVSPERGLELAGLTRGVKVFWVREQKKDTPRRRNSTHEGQVTGVEEAKEVRAENAAKQWRGQDHGEP